MHMAGYGRVCIWLVQKVDAGWKSLEVRVHTTCYTGVHGATFVCCGFIGSQSLLQLCDSFQVIQAKCHSQLRLLTPHTQTGNLE